MVFFRFAGALVGFFFGFFLAAQLLQISQVTPPNNQVLVVLLLAVACAILGWLGAPYATVMPMAWIQGRIPPELMGRVMGLLITGSVGLVPISELGSVDRRTACKVFSDREESDRGPRSCRRRLHFTRVEASGEDRQPSEKLSFGLVEKSIAPFNRRA